MTMSLRLSASGIERFLTWKLGRSPGVGDDILDHIAPTIETWLLHEVIPEAVRLWREEVGFRKQQSLRPRQFVYREHIVRAMDSRPLSRQKDDIRPLNDDIGGGQERGSDHESEEEPAEEKGPQGGE